MHNLNFCEEIAFAYEQHALKAYKVQRVKSVCAINLGTRWRHISEETAIPSDGCHGF
jgi:hypothetical protein